MKNIGILVISLFCSLFLYGQDSAVASKIDESMSENIYYSTYGGIYKVSHILSEKKSRKYELKINNLSYELTKHTINLNDLLKTEAILVPKNYTFLGGLYTIPTLTEEQKVASTRKKKVRKLKRIIKELNVKRSYLITRYNRLKSRDAEEVQITLLWGFIGWGEKKSDRIQLLLDNL